MIWLEKSYERIKGVVVRELFHRPAERRLRVVGELISLVEEDDSKLVAVEGGASEFLDLIPRRTVTALVGSVELEEVLLPVVPVDFAGGPFSPLARSVSLVRETGTLRVFDSYSIASAYIGGIHGRMLDGMQTEIIERP